MDYCSEGGEPCLCRHCLLIRNKSTSEKCCCLYLSVTWWALVKAPIVAWGSALCVCVRAQSLTFSSCYSHRGEIHKRKVNFTKHIQTNAQKSSPSIENIFLVAVIIFSNIIVLELKWELSQKSWTIVCGVPAQAEFMFWATEYRPKSSESITEKAFLLRLGDIPSSRSRYL